MKNALYLLLFLAAAAFFFDLFHMAYHLSHDETLRGIDGIYGRLLVKIVTFCLPIGLLLCRRVWVKWLCIGLFLFFLQPDLAVAGTGCSDARDLMEKSGMARDAKENLFGKIKLTPPYGSYPSEMDKITWWGQFKPFEFWDNPEFQATWINPEGEEVMKQSFRGNKCKLAKTTVRGEDQPRGQFTPGMWNVVITCDEHHIDQQTFAVLPSGGMMSSPDAPQQSQETAMIWAEESVKD